MREFPEVSQNRTFENRIIWTFHFISSREVNEESVSHMVMLPADHPIFGKGHATFLECLRSFGEIGCIPIYTHH